MNEQELLKKIAIAKAKPDTLTDISPRDLADLVLVVLQYAKEINKQIIEGKIKGEKGADGQDARNLVPDVDFLSLPTAKAELAKFKQELTSKVLSDAQNALSQLRNGKDGKDAQVTKEQLEMAAKMASDLIDLPDFRKYITEQPEAIRDSLELLQEDERLDVSAIKGLDELLKKYEGKKEMVVGGIRFLSQLADVRITSIANNDVLKWNSTTLQWENGQVSGGGGAVDSVNGQTGVVVLDADDIDDTSTTNKFVTSSDLTKLSNLSGTNTGDQDLSSYLTSATAASTYEPLKGTDDNFVTDAEKTKLSNLSGTNTGDQDLTPYFNKSVDDLDDITAGTTNKHFTDTEKTKLSGIETGADVTDATNVAAAGAFMKSVDDTDDITVGTTNKFATAAEKTKLGHISVTQAVDLDAIETNSNASKVKTDFITVTQAVDLDTLESDTATNNTKVTNATHTGDVTGATSLTVDKTAITGKTLATAVGTDYILISDTSDSGNLKKALASDLTGSGGATWGSITGTLSTQTDLQTALDGKVDENAAITGATKTKITYDAKGLVTSGADATTADIADSANKRYVTDAQLTVIGNTSGTNTGDQSSIVGITGTKAQFDTSVTDGNFMYIGDAPTAHTHAKTDLTDIADFLLESEVDADIKTLSLPASTTISAFGATLVDDIDNSAARTTLGLGTAATKATDLADLNEATIEAAIDTLANLTSIQGRTVTLADAGADALFGWDDSANAYQNLSAADVRTALSLVVGTNVQAYDADLTTWAGITPGTGVGTALGVNVGTAGAFVVNGGALGTPSSGVATNLTGTASGLTAGTVTTNANLTGDVTSVGNATTIANGAVDIAMLSATGTPSGTTYLRGDNTWSTIAGGGDVSKVGTPVDNQIGVWTGDGTIEGTTGLTYNGSNLLLTGDIGSTGSRITKGWFADLVVDNINLNGNTISSTDSNGDINITPDGTGDVILGGHVGVGIATPESGIHYSGEVIGTYTTPVSSTVKSGTLSEAVYSSDHAVTAAAAGGYNLSITTAAQAASTTLAGSFGNVTIETGLAFPANTTIAGASYSVFGATGGTGSAPKITGFFGVVGRLGGSETITEAIGAELGYIDTVGSQTTTSVIGVKVNTPINIFGHTITNTYGLYLESQASVASGAQTNTPYGIYVAGASDRNYIAGTLDLGHLSDTTISRASAGVVAVEGKALVNLTDGGTFAADISVPDDAYGAGWNGNTEVPTKNAIYDKIETLGSGSAEATTKDINQTTHGFAVGDIVKYSGSAYAKAQADSSSNAEVVGIISAVADANNFTLATVGFISGLSGLTANTTYFLSASSAGALTSTEPSTAGQISKPLLRAVSTTAGYFFNFRGVAITEASGGATKEFFVPALERGDTPTTVPYETVKGQFPITNIANNQNNVFAWFMPADFTSLTSVSMVMIPDATETIQWDCYVNFAAVGEAYNANSASDINRTLGVTVDVLTAADITQGSVFSGIAANDYVGVTIDSNTSNIRILGLKIKYS